MKSYKQILEEWSIESTGYSWEALCNILDAENIKSVATVAAKKYSDQIMLNYTNSLRGAIEKTILSKSKIKHHK